MKLVLVMENTLTSNFCLCLLSARKQEKHEKLDVNIISIHGKHKIHFATASASNEPLHDFETLFRSTEKKEPEQFLSTLASIVTWTYISIREVMRERLYHGLLALTT